MRFFNELRVRVHAARVDAGKAARPGTVLAALDDGLLVACGSGALALTRLQAEGKRVVSGKDFVLGYRVKEGMAWS